MRYQNILSYIQALSITLICTVSLYGNENEDIFKKIILLNESGKRTVVNAESIIGFERIEVNKTNNRLTTVLETDYEGNIIKNLYRASPNEICSLADEVDVRFMETHKGVYFNPKYFADVQAFVTNKSILFKDNMTIAKVNDLRSHAAGINNRTGKLILQDQLYIKVSKRKVPKVRKHLKFQGFKRWWSRFLSINAVGLIQITTDTINSTGDSVYKEDFSNPVHRLVFANRLLKEYNKIQYLEGDIPLLHEGFKNLVVAYRSWREFQIYPVETGEILRNAGKQNLSIWQLSPFERSIIGLLTDLNVFPESSEDSRIDLMVQDSEEFLESFTEESSHNKYLLLLLVILLTAPFLWSAFAGFLPKKKS